MLRSMFSAISGLRNHQVYLDVLGNNIANVNTTGFRSSRVTFQDILSQTVRGASPAQGGRGAINPAQVGLGTVLAGIDTMQTQGNLQATGRLTDLAIQGDGFFILNDGAGNYYTRDGSFDLSTDGRLVSPSTGYLVQGWQADATGAINTSAPTTAITIPIGAGMTGQVTTEAVVRGNLDASVTDTTIPFRTTVSVYDSLGVRHEVTLTFYKTATANRWTWTPSTTETGVTVAPAAASNIDFTAAGEYDPANPAATLTITLTNGATSPMTVDLDMSELTQFSATTELNTTQDGVGPGSLVTFTIGASGEVVAVYSNGQTEQIAQLALASFANPAGLSKIGNNMFSVSASSGDPQLGAPQSGGRGMVNAGFLEMSNVDLAQQFTNMIIAQRGFQANSRVITTSDEMLQELVNLKR